MYRIVLSSGVDGFRGQVVERGSLRLATLSHGCATCLPPSRQCVLGRSKGGDGRAVSAQAASGHDTMLNSRATNGQRTFLDPSAKYPGDFLPSAKSLASRLRFAGRCLRGTAIAAVVLVVGMAAAQSWSQSLAAVGQALVKPTAQTIPLAPLTLASVSQAAPSSSLFASLTQYLGTGFMSAFSIIFLSELGDKTFFIAGLLAAKVGRTVAFTGTMIALGAMTVISVGLGVAFNNIPAPLLRSMPVGEWVGATMLAVFGVSTIVSGLKQQGVENSENEELRDAEETVALAGQKGEIALQKTRWDALLQTCSLIFLAEWGDRSMLATVALGAAHSPLGVTGGAIFGHGAATYIAIMGGGLAAKYFTETKINIFSGICFLVFAALTALSAMGIIAA